MASRWKFIDVLRGLAIVLMVFNHTARYLLDISVFGYEQFVYGTMIMAGPVFLFLVGFSLALSFEATKKNIKSNRKIISKYVFRGLIITAVGFFLSFCVFLDEQSLTSNVLHTIGEGIILAIPFLYFSQKSIGRLLTLFLAIIVIISFYWLYLFFVFFSLSHQIIAQMFLSGFQLVPWFGVILLGIVSGNFFILSVQKNQASLFFKKILGLGICSFLVFICVQMINPQTLWLFSGDYDLNGFWLPSGAMMIFILSGIMVCLSAVYYLVEIKKINLQFLIDFGRASLVLYVWHLFLVVVVFEIILGLNFFNWFLFFVFDLLLFVFLWQSAKIWIEIKKYLKKYVY
ncbi:MAG: heparan-alpha-glucosaminide N-acetyltransferase domain-containing protein [bacterium]